MVALVAVAGPKLVTDNRNDRTPPTFAALVLAVLPTAKSVLVPTVACAKTGKNRHRLAKTRSRIGIVFMAEQDLTQLTLLFLAT